MIVTCFSSSVTSTLHTSYLTWNSCFYWHNLLPRYKVSSLCEVNKEASEENIYTRNVHNIVVENHSRESSNIACSVIRNLLKVPGFYWNYISVKISILLWMVDKPKMIKNVIIPKEATLPYAMQDMKQEPYCLAN